MTGGGATAAGGSGPGDGRAARPQGQEQQQPVMVISTYPDRAEASKAAEAIVGSRLAACANISEVSSFYWWDGAVVRDEREQIVIFKTTSHRKDDLKDEISRTHPYDVPEIAEVHVRDINGPYMRWLASSTGVAGRGR